MKGDSDKYKMLFYNKIVEFLEVTDLLTFSTGKVTGVLESWK